MTPWETFCQHAKAGLQEEYQSNWLNENQENQIVTDAFTQAKEENFESLKLIGKNLETSLAGADLDILICGCHYLTRFHLRASFVK